MIKKLFIKIARILNYELIDQNKFISPTLNSEINDRLIYNRKLELGIGNEEYGLEVAKSLSIDTEFMNNAYKVKNKLKHIGLY